MANYRISMRRDGAQAEFSVGVHDETCRSLARVGALSTLHAKKVVRDLITLVRRSDPDSVFTVKRDPGTSF